MFLAHLPSCFTLCASHPLPPGDGGGDAAVVAVRMATTTVFLLFLCPSAFACLVSLFVFCVWPFCRLPLSLAAIRYAVALAEMLWLVTNALAAASLWSKLCGSTRRKRLA